MVMRGQPQRGRRVAGLASITVAGALALGAGACEPEPAPRADEPRTLSADAVWAGGTPWTIDPEPVFRVDGSDPEYPLTQVVAAHLVDDDLLILADRSRTPSVSAFDGSGEGIWRWSEVGQGPGELSFLALAWIAPDTTLGLYDPSSSRVIRLEARTGASAGHVTFDWLPAMGGTGTVLRGPAGPNSLIGWPNGALGEVRDGISYTPVYLVDIDERTSTPFTEVARMAVASGPDPHPPILGARRVVAYAGEGRLLYGLGLDFRVTEWRLDAGGEPEPASDFGRPYDRRPVSASMIEAQKQIDLARPTSSPPDEWAAHVERLYAEQQIAELLPAFDRILVDALDHVWVRHFVAPGDTVSHWSIFDAERAWLGEIGVPASIEIMDVGVERIAATETDAFDVPSVVVLRLQR